MAKVTPRKKAGSKQNSKKSTPVDTPNKQKKNVKASKREDDQKEIPNARILSAIGQLNKFTTESKAKEDGKQSLLDDEDELNKSLNLIVVNNKSFSGSTKNFKLKLFDVKNSLYIPWKASSVTSVKDFKTLLILKDGEKDLVSEDELFDELNESKITLDQIITGQDLKSAYKEFESRRAFISEFSLILADDNIITTLPKLLGGKAYSKLETTPIPIRSHSSNKEFSKTTLVNSIKKVYLTKLPVKLPRGTTMNVHLGNLEWFKPEELAENIESITKTLIEAYNIRSIFIKSNQSPVLPLYYNNDVLDELTSIAKEAIKHNNESVTIDGVDVQLSNFDKSLMEIANPKEYSNIFAKQIKDAKRERGDEVNEAKPKTKKAKNL